MSDVRHDDVPGPAWEDPRRALSRHGLRPKRGYSQNFLVAREIVEQIAEWATPTTGEPVVEIGPGLGTLTGALLRRGANVIAVERDPQMLQVLRDDLVPYGRLALIEADATRLDISNIAAEHGGPVALTGNLPYAITGMVLRRIIEGHRNITKAVIMVQREVGDRLSAEPGTRAYGALTVFTSAVFEISRQRTVPATAFHPRPEVTSAVVKLEPRATPRVHVDASFETVVRAAFGARRKTLRNALQQLCARGNQDDKQKAATALEMAGIDGQRRGETLTVEEFGRLAHAWSISVSSG